jgi:hypothetical protein
MKLINFVPQQIRRRHLRKQTIIASSIATLIAGVSVIGMWLSLKYDISLIKSKTAVQQVVVTKTTSAPIITPDIINRESAITALSKTDINWVKAFKVVGTLLQKDIVLTSYTYSVASGNVVLSMTGNAPSNYSFTTFLQSLNSATNISGVKVDGYTYSALKQTVTFSISASVPINQINYAIK